MLRQALPIQFVLAQPEFHSTHQSVKEIIQTNIQLSNSALFQKFQDTHPPIMYLLRNHCTELCIICLQTEQNTKIQMSIITPKFINTVISSHYKNPKKAVASYLLSISYMKLIIKLSDQIY